MIGEKGLVLKFRRRFSLFKVGQHLVGEAVRREEAFGSGWEVGRPERSQKGLTQVTPLTW